MIRICLLNIIFGKVLSGYLWVWVIRGKKKINPKRVDPEFSMVGGTGIEPVTSTV
jgi:hypothetical protein